MTAGSHGTLGNKGSGAGKKLRDLGAHLGAMANQQMPTALVNNKSRSRDVGRCILGRGQGVEQVITGG